MSIRTVSRWTIDALFHRVTVVTVVAITSVVSLVVVRFSGGCSEGTSRGSWGAMSCGTSEVWVYVLPALSGAAAAVFVTAPYERNEDQLYLSRGVKKPHLHLARLVSALAAAAAILTAVLFATTAVAVLALPWRAEALDATGIVSEPGYEAPSPGLSVSLWRQNPLVHDVLLLAPLLVTAALALVTVAAFVGYLTKNSIAAFFGPILIIVIFQLAPLSGGLERFNPYLYLVVQPDHPLKYLGSEDIFLPMLGFWIAVLIVGLALVALVSRLRRITG